MVRHYETGPRARNDGTNGGAAPTSKEAVASHLEQQPFGGQTPMITGGRVKIKGNPIRDAVLVLTFLGMLLYITADIGSPGRAQNAALKSSGLLATVEAFLTRFTVNVNDKVAEKATSILGAVEEIMKSEAEKGMRADPCAVFMTTSSIPGAGGGLFAGQSFSLGDVVLETSMLLPLHQEASIFVPPHALVINHHPELVNVQGKLVANSWDETTVYELKALRAIQPGEELMVSFSEHPHAVYGSAFEHIPTLADYELADSVRRESSTISNLLRSFGKKHIPKEHRDIMYAAYQRGISKVNRKIGLLLPANDAAGKLHMGKSSAISSLKKRTIKNLQMFGSCLVGDLTVQNGVSTSTRTIEQGKLVTRIPMHALKNDMTCSSDDCQAKEACIGQGFSQVILCPLIQTSLFPQQPSSADSGNSGNVQLVWSDASVSGRPVDLVLAAATAGNLLVDVIAVTDIQAGQEVSKIVRPYCTTTLTFLTFYLISVTRDKCNYSSTSVGSVAFLDDRVYWS
jgi:hypothetical protein